MPLLPICLFPDPILRQRSKPADWKAPDTQRLIRNLAETLYRQRGGIGIAAPQVGVTLRVVLIDVSARDPSKHIIAMINPLILNTDGHTISREGCMSLPDYTANLLRATTVVVSWIDPAGKPHSKHASGIEAICIQHELDHLNGALFIDRVSSLKTDVFPRVARRSSMA